MSMPYSQAAKGGLWSRVLHWLRRLDDALNWDETAELAARIEHLERAVRRTTPEKPAEQPRRPTI